MVLVEALYYFLPAYVANTLPPLITKINPLPQRIDAGVQWRGKPLLGKSKTWGGFLFGVFGGVLTYAVQAWLYQFSFFQNISLINYELVWLGFLLSFGALFGDVAKSFLKRRRGIKASGPWFPWDQEDFVIGALLFSAPVFFPSWTLVLIIFLITPLLQLGVSWLGWKLGLKEVWW